MNRLINFTCRAVTAGLLVATMPLWVAQAAIAQSSSEPAVVISLSSIDEQMADIDYLANAAGETIGQSSGFIKMQMQGFLRGVDTSQPLGAVLYFNEDSPEPTAVGFVPVSNLDDVLNTLSGFAEIDEDGDNITIIPDNGQELTVRERGGYAFVSDNKEALDRAPEDPASLIGDIGSRYNFAARIYPQRVPENLRNQALDLIRQGYEQQLQMLEQAEPLQAELQRKQFDMQMAQMESLIHETEELVVGFAADQNAQALYFDMTMTGLDGSKLAERVDMAKQAGPSQFAGFKMDGAAMTANMVNKLMEEDIQQYTKLMGELRETAIDQVSEEGNLAGEQLELVEALFNDMFDVLEDTLRTGNMDVGAVLKTDDGTINFATGMYAVSSEKMEDALRRLAEAAKQDPKAADVVEFHFDASRQRGVTFHEIDIRIPEDEEEARQMLGDTLKIVVGIGDKKLYLAGGSDPMALLDQAMNASAQSSGIESGTMLEWNVYLTPIMKFAAGIDGAEMVAPMAEKLSEVGRDRIRVVSRCVDKGLQTRLEIQDGILALIGVAAEQMQQGMGAGPGADF